MAGRLRTAVGLLLGMLALCLASCASAPPARPPPAPRDVRPHFRKAYDCFNMRDWTGALAHIEAVLAIEPANATALELRKIFEEIREESRKARENPRPLRRRGIEADFIPVCEAGAFQGSILEP